MHSVIFQVTTKCNLRCKHCFLDHSRAQKEISLDIIEKILDEVKPYKTDHVSLTGGELFLHTKLQDILSIISRKGFVYRMVTNGSLFEENLDLIKRFRENLDRICFSIDGATAETHDFIRGKGSFEKVIRAVDICKNLGIRTIVQFTANQRNLNEMGKIMNMALEKKFDQLFINTLIPQVKGSNKVLESLMLTPKQRVSLAKKVIALQDYTNNKIEGTSLLFTMCRLGCCRALNLGAISIDVDGNLTFCCNINHYIPEQDVQPMTIISLKTHTLAEGLELLAKKISQVQIAKLKDIPTNKYNSWSQCEYCLHALGYDVYHKE